MIASLPSSAATLGFRSGVSLLVSVVCGCCGTRLGRLPSHWQTCLRRQHAAAFHPPSHSRDGPHQEPQPSPTHRPTPSTHPPTHPHPPTSPPITPPPNQPNNQLTLSALSIDSSSSSASSLTVGWSRRCLSVSGFPTRAASFTSGCAFCHVIW